MQLLYKETYHISNMIELQFLCQISAWNFFPYMICIARKRSKGIQLFYRKRNFKLVNGIPTLPSKLDLQRQHRYKLTITILEIDKEGRLRTKLQDKRDAFNFRVVNFLFIYSNIPAAPVYAEYISQLIRYSRVCGSYQDFLFRGLLLTRRLLHQGFLVVKLKSSLRKFTVSFMTGLTVTKYLCHK